MDTTCQHAQAELAALERELWPPSGAQPAGWPTLKDGRAVHWSLALLALAECFEAPTLEECLAPLLPVDMFANDISLRDGCDKEEMGRKASKLHNTRSGEDDSDSCKSFMTASENVTDDAVSASAEVSSSAQQRSSPCGTVVGASAAERASSAKAKTTEPVGAGAAKVEPARCVVLVYSRVASRDWKTLGQDTLTSLLLLVLLLLVLLLLLLRCAHSLNLVAACRYRCCCTCLQFRCPLQGEC